MISQASLLPPSLTLADNDAIIICGEALSCAQAPAWRDWYQRLSTPIYYFQPDLIDAVAPPSTGRPIDDMPQWVALTETHDTMVNW